MNNILFLKKFLGYRLLGTLVLLGLFHNSHAVQVCELNGQHVNPSNGSTTAGKTGLMRCRDGEGGPVVREEELQNGVFMGIKRYYKEGVLEREFSVNEKGNRDGLLREYAARPGAGNQLLREATLRNSTTVGIARRWHPAGQLRQVTFYDDTGQAEAAVEFTADGKLASLRCGSRPQLAPHADDAAWCGHGGAAPATVTLHGNAGQVAGTLTHERGELRKSQTLWANGTPRQQIESNPQGGNDTQFWESGAKRREIQWLNQSVQGRAQRVTVLDREYHNSGQIVGEKRFKPAERGAELESEQRWYLNGQPSSKREYSVVNGGPTYLETRHHDNGQKSFEGAYVRGARGGETAVGVHKGYDAGGRLRTERHYAETGRVARERAWDEAGTLTRDDELFEDGSRKTHSR